MRCSEQQWKIAQVDGYPLSVQLIKLGYDLSLLQFYPNKPYVATFYKQSSNKISTTNTPFKDGREVMETFDASLFYALCCQLDGDHVTTGEFITTNQGKVFQVHSLEGTWLRHNHPDGKNSAFAKASVHKSTFPELFAWLNDNPLPAVGMISIEEQIQKKNKPERKIKTLEAEATSESTLAAAAKILASVNEMTIEQMIDCSNSLIYGATKSEKEISDQVAVEIIPITENKSVAPPFPSNKSEINEWLGSLVIPKSKDPVVLENIKSHCICQPMNFKDLLSWFADHDSIVWGFIEKGEIHSEIRSISHISKESVLLSGDNAETEFHQIFQDQQHFLNYALSKIKTDNPL
ncbi:hypothetical protein [Dyadobacter sp. 3J3]|uniref:hypothetical protein n=1 Tax=Dyadobacter sp. 3J3 TaxID=2606600 RepID=UPI00135AD486|nr:hypothetical protein [Dyadobacter sp. 3J3]